MPLSSFAHFLMLANKAIFYHKKELFVNGFTAKLR